MGRETSPRPHGPRCCAGHGRGKDNPAKHIIQSARAAVNSAEKGFTTMKKTVNANTAREDMTAAAVLYMSGEDLQTLAAAAVENAMKRREADSGRDLLQMRVKYQEDARQEAIADMLERVLGDWIEGTTKEGTPRADMPIAYFAAICAGRALDRIMYQDGGHAVKLTAKEARENYGADKESAADMARAAVVVETRRTTSPIAPAPEGALIEAERVERILQSVPADVFPRAVDMARAMYEGAESVREAGRLAGLTQATARRTWQAVKDAARDVLQEDGDAAALERMNADEERRRAAKNRAARDASEARRAKALKDKPAAPSGAVRFTAGRPDRLASTAKHTPERLEALRKLARAMFDAQAK